MIQGPYHLDHLLGGYLVSVIGMGNEVHQALKRHSGLLIYLPVLAV